MDKTIDELVAQIARELKAKQPADTDTVAGNTVSNFSKTTAPVSNVGLTTADYPLLKKHPELVSTPTGKNISAITMETVRNGETTGEDLRISREMLLNQAQIADSAGKTQVAENFRRAAEMTGVPDDQVIHMYDMLRPNRSTKQQLQELADTLKNRYNAVLLAKLVSDAMAIYEKRGILVK